jgi:hypothetical protein
MQVLAPPFVVVSRGVFLYTVGLGGPTFGWRRPCTNILQPLDFSLGVFPIDRSIDQPTNQPGVRKQCPYLSTVSLHEVVV